MTIKNLIASSFKANTSFLANYIPFIARIRHFFDSFSHPIRLRIHLIQISEYSNLYFKEFQEQFYLQQKSIADILICRNPAANGLSTIHTCSPMTAILTSNNTPQDNAPIDFLSIWAKHCLNLSF